VFERNKPRARKKSYEQNYEPLRGRPNEQEHHRNKKLTKCPLLDTTRTQLFIRFKRKNSCSRNRARTRTEPSVHHTIQETEQEQKAKKKQASYQERVACLLRVVSRPVSMALAAVRAHRRRAAETKESGAAWRRPVGVDDAC
jgi:CRISPR/Cas system CMR subunit Cmr4 (Cas7 group RAMP superfamily)